MSGSEARPTVLIVAGETSGDMHGANLARALQAARPGIRLCGAGGPRMRDAGVEIVADPVRHAAVGIVEAFQSMHHYARLYRLLISALRTRRPDAAVLIDFPDFNLRFAERAHDHGVPVVYYISPQVWAWRSGRVKAIRRLVRKMVVILEFERDWYRERGVDAAFVGHPLLDAVGQIDRGAFRRELGVPEGGTLIGLLPGSRSKQWASLYPLMKKAAAMIGGKRADAKFVVACAPSIDPRKAQAGGLPFVWNRTPEVMASSDLLLTSSGTSTIEAAIHGAPMIVTYKVNPLSALTLGPFIKVKDYALVNIVAGRRIMPEYYQFRAKPDLIAKEALSILNDGRLAEMRAQLADVRKKLGTPGASKRAAAEVLAVVDAARR
jgi:lipid-A-disaccharide synthase